MTLPRPGAVLAPLLAADSARAAGYTFADVRGAFAGPVFSTAAG